MGLMDGLQKLSKAGMALTGNPMGFANESSPFGRIVKTGEGVARIMGGDVAGGAAAIGQGLAKEGSAMSRLAGAVSLGSDLANGLKGVAGQRGAMGEANLGVDTNLGYGPVPGQIDMPELGTSMRRRAMRGPSLMGRG